ncbi:MAG TPA: DNA-formamidopyrimidine glycosylase family protein [Kineosporiaceae bacterium]|nr:DNA-formamidopyrimidine glycosylase family protein [Kineosporiaceae bacterium]
MPEGDVVWRTARRLDAALSGRLLTVSDLRWPSLATVDLSGRSVLEVASAGKHLLTRVEGGLTLHSHLRMDGSWHVHRTGKPWAGRGAEHKIRAVLANQEWTAIGHDLGMLDLVPTDAEHTLIGHLGPDVLGSGWDPVEAARRMAAGPQRPVGEVLLDQRVLAGVGTYFMSEALFLRGVTPWTPSGQAGDLDLLVSLIKRLLEANRDRAVQSTTGDQRPGRRQYVHSRSGRPCRRCGATVRVASVGRPPNDRVAFYCPSCQRGPTPTDTSRPQRPLGARPPATAAATGGRRRPAPASGRAQPPGPPGSPGRGR